MKVIEERAGLKGRWQCTYCGTVVELDELDEHVYVLLTINNKPSWPMAKIMCPVDKARVPFWLVSNV